VIVNSRVALASLFFSKMYMLKSQKLYTRGSFMKF